jgi:hypothetical protein
MAIIETTIDNGPREAAASLVAEIGLYALIAGV